MNDEQQPSGGFFNGFVLGSLVGAALVFLHTTEEGKKIKQEITSRGKNALEDLPTIVKQLEKQGEEFARRTNKVKQELEKKAREFAQSESASSAAPSSNSSSLKTLGQKFFTRRGKRLG